MSSTAVLGLGVKDIDFLRAPNWVNVSTLGASSAVGITLPVGVQMVELKCNLDFWVCWGSTGVSTAGAVTNGTGSELIPVQSGGVRRNIVSTNATTAISVMSTAGATITQSWWTL